MMTASERLAELLRLGANTAALVFDPSNMFYLTEGYTGKAWCLFPGTAG